jgi:hypothetical protein
MQHRVKDPYWDCEKDILNDFSKIEIPLESFDFFRDNISSDLNRRRFRTKVIYKVLKFARESLNDLQLKVFLSYFILQKSQVEIEKDLGITQAYVSYIIKGIVKKMRNAFHIICS